MTEELIDQELLESFDLPNLTKLSENSKMPLNPRFCVLAVR